MTERLTAAKLREIEDTLTADQIERACNIVRAAGWMPYDMIPLFVWAEAFNKVKADQ